MTKTSQVESVTIVQEKSSVSYLGEQKIIVVQKANHDKLKGFLDRKLKITITLETLDD